MAFAQFIRDHWSCPDHPNNMYEGVHPETCGIGIGEPWLECDNCGAKNPQNGLYEGQIHSFVTPGVACGGKMIKKYKPCGQKLVFHEVGKN